MSAPIETVDAVTEEESSRRQHRTRERAARERHERFEVALEEFDKRAAAKRTSDRVSMTDPDARVMKQAEGHRAERQRADRNRRGARRHS